MDGQTETLFAPDGEMMDLIESKNVMIPNSKRTDAHQNTNAVHKCSPKQDHALELGEYWFSTYLTSTFYASVATDNMETFLGHCRSLFTIPRSRYLSRRDLQQRKQHSDEPVRLLLLIWVV